MDDMSVGDEIRVSLILICGDSIIFAKIVRYDCHLIEMLLCINIVNIYTSGLLCDELPTNTSL